MCSKGFIYIIYFICTSLWTKRRPSIMLSPFSNWRIWEGNRATCLWLHSVRGRSSRKRCLLTTSFPSFSFVSSLFLKVYSIRELILLWKTSVLKLDAFYKFVCFDTILISLSLPAFLYERWYKNEKKYTYRNEMKIINKALFYFQYSKSCCLRLQSQYDANRTIRYDSYHT